MRYRLDQPEFNNSLRSCDDVVLDLPAHVLAIEDAVADLKLALDGTDCGGTVETCGADVILPDARATVVRCENAVGAGWGVSVAIAEGDEDMADAARLDAR
ncbi:hypothetical protein [Zhihengliuella sp.]|uniref:hypothetical protein n=1 Tax=Zhihengliuella sp. TaxID=1954483 RepID=UPI0028122D78|nr:hypothetical protein [Zhihengliuella sp.]